MKVPVFHRIVLTPMAGVFLVLAACMAVVAWPKSEVEAVVLDQSPRDFFRPPSEMPKFVVVSVASGGELSVMGRPVGKAALGEALRREFTPEADTPVYVRADADVPYGTVVEAYQQIEAAGFAGRVRTMNEELE